MDDASELQNWKYQVDQLNDAVGINAQIHISTKRIGIQTDLYGMKYCGETRYDLPLVSKFIYYLHNDLSLRSLAKHSRREKHHLLAKGGSGHPLVGASGCWPANSISLVPPMNRHGTEHKSSKLYSPKTYLLHTVREFFCSKKPNRRF